MATLKTNTLTGTSTAGSIAVTGEGNSTTTNLQQGLAKAWVFSIITSSTPANTDSLNISSITDAANGSYKPNLTNAMGNITFCITVTAQYTTTSGTGAFFDQEVRTDRTTSQVTMQHYENGSLADAHGMNCDIHGDLA
jgi:hypothetical protein|tara:strand:+ start:739 stop:1152 length:414 start_codon:yes stop_codon:yes gene_type:complete